MYSDAQPRPLSLYIHWPFCVSKCPYCDFNSHVRDGVDPDIWLDALLRDMAHEAELTAPARLISIFFGGGTPSLMPPALVERLIEAAGRHWTMAGDVEITLEANPSSVEAARFADLATAGVNRVSLGLQSLDDAQLRFLGRAHDVSEGLSALDTAIGTFERVSFDLIYALPEQTIDEWQAELQLALGFGTSHLSLYQLTIEPGTRFASDYRKQFFSIPDEGLAADFYTLTQELLTAAGLPAYETSNHARPGQESRHNLTYWRYGDYVGIGPGAHGRRGKMGTERHKKPENYLSAIARNGHGISREIALSPHDRAVEAMLMGLRLAEGVNLDLVAKRTGLPPSTFLDEVALGRLVRQGLVRSNDSRIALTSEGGLLLDAILGEIVRLEPESDAA